VLVAAGGGGSVAVFFAAFSSSICRCRGVALRARSLLVRKEDGSSDLGVMGVIPSDLLLWGFRGTLRRSTDAGRGSDGASDEEDDPALDEEGGFL
jgi:hypothetical protein